MTDNIAIKVESVSKSFRLPHQKKGSVKNVFLNIFRGRTTYEKQDVLKNVSFEIKEGEFFGILGRNGSGKSTLLKLIAGIYSSDSGFIELNGKLTPFIELGVGFNPELTGRENVFLNGALLGFSRSEMEKMYKKIVVFAELEKFMDQKLKNYSSGMQVRLAFSIAIRAKTSILLIDEVLAVGDVNFQKKCFEVFKQMKREGNTVVFVSHDVGAVREYCNRAILIDNGEIISEGDTDMVVGEYLKANKEITIKKLEKLNKHNLKTRKPSGEGGVKIGKIWITDKKNKESVLFKPKETIVINCDITSYKNYTNPSIVIKCNNPGGAPVFSVNTLTKKIKLDLRPKDRISLRWEIPNIFNDGIYLVSVIFLDNEIVQDQVVEGLKFEIEGWEYPYSITHPEDSFNLKKLTK